ncbi:hypothetical protein [Nocardiopsis lambiniae]|uniref:DUF3592 domain-containing protein n=1 Tax=Nocardiopsis lambiniae TaxID=3075539 RepID=A0ABU2M399_9ACTN|nr:hypothetical protein [Nocardiopsis sp. DSM 44743]MDT0327121.1 hypothetical protein [Nocardiopsis sp. DSM 44743]
MYARQPPPRVSPSELRPGRFGYWAGGVVMVLGGVAGVVAFVVFLLQAVTLPDFAAQLPGDGEVVFSHTPGEEAADIALYSTSPANGPYECELFTPGGEPTAFTDPEFHQEDSEWTLVGVASPQEAGEYTLVCEDHPDHAYAVAPVPEDFGVIEDVVGALASLFLLPLAGLVVGLVLIVSTAVRRGLHKKRLLAERAGYPYRG